ncbi:MAG: MATE family efflux transporter [Spirochaetales bacterium]|nr:MATE family efflux transporter [Spirochaetales bacterium]
MKNNNPLSKNFTAGELLKFAFPTLFMMVFSGLYTIVDTIFISRLVNTIALSSLNIVTPIINLLVGLGAMIATGGSAIVARKQGEGKEFEARRDFSLISLTALSLGLIISIAGLSLLEPIIYGLGADDEIAFYAKDYLSLLLLFAPASILQVIFSVFFVTAGRPRLGFILTLCAGLTNAIFDYVFMGPLQMGIHGAALATGMGYMVQTLGGIIFFASNKSGALHYVMPRFNFRVISESFSNGLSEMVGHLSSAVTTFLFNISMMKLLGSDGVAAITIIIYSQFLLSTFCIGFSMGVAPVFSYNYGSQNHEQMKRLFRICVTFILSISAIVFASAMLGGPWLCGIFAQKGSGVYKIARAGFMIVPFAFLFSGLNIFSSSLFTALSNGRLSAIISFTRSLGLLSAGILLLPLLLGIRGLWLAIPLAECGTFLIAMCFIWKKKMVYGYL